MAESNVAAAPKETQQSAKPTRKGSLLSRVAYSFGNVGQSAFYNALSTYFIVYVTSSLFSGVDKALATKLIGVITGLVVVIRIAEIFIDPLLGNIVDNTTTKWGRFRPWQFLGGLVSALLLPDAPIVAWWPHDFPANPSGSSIGRIAHRRITDSTTAEDVVQTLADLAANYRPGDTDIDLPLGSPHDPSTWGAL